MGFFFGTVGYVAVLLNNVVLGCPLPYTEWQRSRAERCLHCTDVSLAITWVPCAPTAKSTPAAFTSTGTAPALCAKSHTAIAPLQHPKSQSRKTHTVDRYVD